MEQGHELREQGKRNHDRTGAENKSLEARKLEHCKKCLSQPFPTDKICHAVLRVEEISRPRCSLWQARPALHAAAATSACQSLFVEPYREEASTTRWTARSLS